jgi:hypothetical protein
MAAYVCPPRVDALPDKCNFESIYNYRIILTAQAAAVKDTARLSRLRYPSTSGPPHAHVVKYFQGSMFYEPMTGPRRHDMPIRISYLDVPDQDATLRPWQAAS